MSPSQETKKERREAARQARIEAQRARERARKRKRLALIGGVLALVVVGAVVLYQRSQSSEKNIASLARAAGCSNIREVDEMDTSHLGAGAPEPKYNSNPPTSGPHMPSTAPWGAHDETVDKKVLVHNLEHGGIVIHYKDLSDRQVDTLSELADSYEDGVIAQPNSEIRTPVAMAAWGHLQTCRQASVPVIRGFIEQRCNKGPEKFGLGC